jgi:hypothetical protein
MVGGLRRGGRVPHACAAAARLPAPCSRVPARPPRLDQRAGMVRPAGRRSEPARPSPRTTVASAARPSATTPNSRAGQGFAWRCSGRLSRAAQTRRGPEASRVTMRCAASRAVVSPDRPSHSRLGRHARTVTLTPKGPRARRAEPAVVPPAGVPRLAGALAIAEPRCEVVSDRRGLAGGGGRPRPSDGREAPGKSRGWRHLGGSPRGAPGPHP